MVAVSSPLVSIGMPIYNEERHLHDALNSLLAQDYANVELIISDNASEDRTELICREYAAKDARIRYHRNERNLGSAVNFNQLFDWARGKYFMWAAGHDLRSPTFVRKCVEALEADPAAVLCCPKVEFRDEEGRPTATESVLIDTRGRGILSRFHLAVWAVSSPYAVYGMLRRSALADCRPAQFAARPDVILLSELALLGPFIVLPEVLLYPLEEWCNLTPEQYRVRMEAMFEDLAGNRKRRIRFFELHHSLQLVRGVWHSRVALWRKPLLSACALLTYPVRSAIDFGVGYRNLPAFVRTPMKKLFRKTLGFKPFNLAGKENPRT